MRNFPLTLIYLECPGEKRETFKSMKGIRQPQNINNIYAVSSAALKQNF